MILGRQAVRGSMLFVAKGYLGGSVSYQFAWCLRRLCSTFFSAFVGDAGFARYVDRSHSSLNSAHGCEVQSPEITDQDDVAAFAASSQRQLPAVTRPVKVENQSRFKIRDLFRRSAS